MATAPRLPYTVPMSRTLAIAVFFAAGCAGDGLPTTERDVAAVSSLLDAIDVHRAVALATDPEGTLELDGSCLVADADLPAELPLGSTRWAGPCFLEDGAFLDGTLTLSPTADGMVLGAEGFSISAVDELEVALSGAVELARVDDLLQLHVSLQSCGTLGPSCAEPDPTVGLDLDYSVYPMDTFPAAYSVSVSGAVDGGGSFVSVEGTWQADTGRCDTEPVEGSVVFGTSPRQSLTLDGDAACDACGAWQVEGFEVDPFCDADAW